MVSLCTVVDNDSGGGRFSSTSYKLGSDSKLSRTANLNFTVAGDHYMAKEVLTTEDEYGIEIEPCTSEGNATYMTESMTSQSSTSWSLGDSNSIVEIVSQGELPHRIAPPSAATILSPAMENNDDDSDHSTTDGDAYPSLMDKPSTEMELYCYGSCSPVYGRRKETFIYNMSRRSNKYSRRRMTAAAPAPPLPPAVLPSMSPKPEFETILVTTSLLMPKLARSFDSLDSADSSDETDAPSCQPQHSVHVTTAKTVSLNISTPRTQGETTNGPVALPQQQFEFESPHLPAPSPLLSLLAMRSFCNLAQCTLLAGHIDFLWRRANISATVPAMRAPYLMFPESNVGVLVERLSLATTTTTYMLSTRGCMATNALDQFCAHQLALVQGRLARAPPCNIRLWAYRDIMPTIVSGGRRDDSPLACPLNANTCRIQLRAWRHRRHNDGSETILHVSDDNIVHCAANVLPFMASPRPSNDAGALFQDVELRAMLKFTKGGDNANTLFPSFSEDDAASVISTAWSDDGLRDEIGALPDAAEELRKELEALMETTNLDGMSDADQDAISLSYSASSDDSEPVVRPRTPIHALPAGAVKKLIPLITKDGRRPFRMIGSEGRRVRFSAENEEFVFVSDSDRSISEDAVTTSSKKEGSSILDQLEDVYYVMEDFIEDLGLACARTQRCYQLKSSVARPVVNGSTPE